MQVKNVSEETLDENIDEQKDIDENIIEPTEPIEPTETVETPTNEMCDVDEGDIRNKGNRKRKNCY